MEDTSIGAPGLLEAVMMCPIQGGRLSTKHFLLYGLVLSLQQPREKVEGS